MSLRPDVKKAKPTGTLQVKIHSASGLQKVQLLGAQDPYCSVSIGAKVFKTHTHNDGGTNPSWEELFTFHNVASSGDLRVEIIDKNILKDKSIGSVVLPLFEILNECEESQVVKNLPVKTKDGQTQGTLKVTLNFKPLVPSYYSTRQTANELETLDSQAPPPYPPPYTPHPGHDEPAPYQPEAYHHPEPSPAYHQAPASGNYSGAPGYLSPAPPTPSPNAFAATPRVQPRGDWILRPPYSGKDCTADYADTRSWLILTQDPEQPGRKTVTYKTTKVSAGNKPVVIKRFNKNRITREEQEAVRREVEILSKLQGNPNVVALDNQWEDNDFVYLAMEYCEGGQLFEDLLVRSQLTHDNQSNYNYTEREAATLARGLISLVAQMHTDGIMHRSLDPENILLRKRGRQGVPVIKVSDFSTATYFKPGEKTREQVGGTAGCLSPEQLCGGEYGQEADLWSCGVILYMVLCGDYPFPGDSVTEVFNNQYRPLDFNFAPWPDVSEEAKDCVRRLLNVDPSKRATADEILRHKWLCEGGCAGDNIIRFDLTRLVSRAGTSTTRNLLKKKALVALAGKKSRAEVQQMRNLFRELDKDRSNSLTVSECLDALREQGQATHDLQEALMAYPGGLDTTINYEEFLALMVDTSDLKDEDLRKVFDEFDLDHDGYLTQEDLQEALAAGNVWGLDPAEIRSILAESDRNNDGMIDFNEFCALMRA